MIFEPLLRFTILLDFVKTVTLRGGSGTVTSLVRPRGART